MKTSTGAKVEPAKAQGPPEEGGRAHLGGPGTGPGLVSSGGSPRWHAALRLNEIGAIAATIRFHCALSASR